MPATPSKGYLDHFPRDNKFPDNCWWVKWFEPNANLVTQFSIGIITAALQLQWGGVIPNNNNISDSPFSDRPATNLHLGSPSIVRITGNHST